MGECTSGVVVDGERYVYMGECLMWQIREYAGRRVRRSQKLISDRGKIYVIKIEIERFFDSLGRYRGDVDSHRIGLNLFVKAFGRTSRIFHWYLSTSSLVI